MSESSKTVECQLVIAVFTEVCCPLLFLARQRLLLLVGKFSCCFPEIFTQKDSFCGIVYIE